MKIYHECGYPLWIDSIHQGECFLISFYDPFEKVKAKKITHCPCCGNILGSLPSNQQYTFSHTLRDAGKSF